MKEVEEERRKKRGGIFGALKSKDSFSKDAPGTGSSKDSANTLPRIMAEINVAPPSQLTCQLDLNPFKSATMPSSRSSTCRQRDQEVESSSSSKDAKDSVNLKKRQKRDVHVDFADENIIHEISADRESLGSEAEGISLNSDSIEDLR